MKFYWEFYLITGMALVTFAIRYTVLGVSDRLKLHPLLIEALRYVPPAILTAIVVPAVLMPEGNNLEITYTNGRLIAAIAAILVGYWQKNLLGVIVVGMVVFLIWQWIF